MMKTIRTKCPHCGKESVVSVKESDYNDWKGGKLIQNAFPYLSVAEREMLITGICDECWKSLWDDELV